MRQSRRESFLFFFFFFFFFSFFLLSTAAECQLTAGVIMVARNCRFVLNRERVLAVWSTKTRCRSRGAGSVNCVSFVAILQDTFLPPFIFYRANYAWLSDRPFGWVVPHRSHRYDQAEVHWSTVDFLWHSDRDCDPSGHGTTIQAGGFQRWKNQSRGLVPLSHVAVPTSSLDGTIGFYWKCDFLSSHPLPVSYEIFPFFDIIWDFREILLV